MIRFDWANTRLRRGEARPHLEPPGRPRLVACLCVTARRQAQLREQQACPEPCRREEAERLDAAITENLTHLGL